MRSYTDQQRINFIVNQVKEIDLRMPNSLSIRWNMGFNVIVTTKILTKEVAPEETFRIIIDTAINTLFAYVDNSQLNQAWEEAQ